MTGLEPASVRAAILGCMTSLPMGLRRLPIRSIVWLGLACAPMRASGQAPPPLHHVGVGLGYGLSSPYGNSSTRGEGVLAMGQYVYRFSAWFEPRAYAGLLLTFPDEAACPGCEVTSKVGFLGGKARVIILIPLIAPFIELGAGLSIGVLRTLTEFTDEYTAGPAVHIPFTLGLALGAHHEFELAFVYLVHPNEQQVGGGIGIGFTFAVR